MFGGMDGETSEFVAGYLSLSPFDTLGGMDLRQREVIMVKRGVLQRDNGTKGTLTVCLPDKENNATQLVYNEIEWGFFLSSTAKDIHLQRAGRSCRSL